MRPKKPTPIVALSFVGLAIAFAGCTGQFDVEQTEPFRIQLEDGETQTVEVREGSDEPERVLIDNDQQTERIDVNVEATATSSDATTIIIRVMNEDTDEVFMERRIVVNEDTTTTNETDENETDEGFFDGQQGQTESVNIQNIDVRGSNNIVIVAESEQGDADVDITASEARGQGQVDTGDDMSDSGGGNETGGDQTGGGQTGGNQTGNETDVFDDEFFTNDTMTP